MEQAGKHALRPVVRVGSQLNWDPEVGIGMRRREPKLKLKGRAELG